MLDERYEASRTSVKSVNRMTRVWKKWGGREGEREKERKRKRKKELLVGR